MNETPETITVWARETFGEPSSIAAVAARAMQELAELVQKLCVDENHPGAREELADVQIVLAQVATYLGFVWEDVEDKMMVNRARRWSSSGDGVGQHIDDVRPIRVCRCGNLMGKLRCPGCGRDAEGY